MGGGQEIHTGEAGIAAWVHAVKRTCPHWRTYVSPDLSASEYEAQSPIDALAPGGRLVRDARLHLATSMRSFRSERVSAFVTALLDCDESRARDLLQQVAVRYPIAATRDLARAKAWIRSHARGFMSNVALSRRLRLCGSSRMPLTCASVSIRSTGSLATRLIHVQATTSRMPPPSFEIQGLEVDWVCVTWDADLRLQRGQWCYHSFPGRHVDEH